MLRAPQRASDSCGLLRRSHFRDSRMDVSSAFLFSEDFLPTYHRIIAEPLTRDHKPDLKEERQYIEAHGTRGVNTADEGP